MLETQQYKLKAMAKNYAGGHRWDHLDSDTCSKAAEEIDTLRTAKQRLEGEVARLKADSARYQFLKENCQQDVDGYRNETPVLVHALSHIPEWRDRIDETIDAALAGKAGDV